MIRPLDGRSRTTPARTCPMTIPALTTAKAIRKPSKSGPASSRSMIQDLRSETSPKKSASKAKPSASSPPLGSRAEGFEKPISSEPAPSPRPWICVTGATPIPRPSLYHVRSAARVPHTIFCSLPEIFFVARTCRIHPAQVKQH
jgi:hypothetical protein